MCFRTSKLLISQTRSKKSGVKKGRRQIFNEPFSFSFLLTHAGPKLKQLFFIIDLMAARLGSFIHASKHGTSPT